MSEYPTRIRVVSLNCWGLKYLSALRHERLSEIGSQLAQSAIAPEIVGLQECWTQQDYLTIREKTKHLLPYGKFYFSGVFGGGLAILSRWPIEQSSMVPYNLNGRPTAFFRGDWFVGKGVACATIRLGPGEQDVAEVFCTHLHAPYEREPNDSYICHRTAQAWQIAKLMRGAAERGHLVIATGDFNMTPLSFAHRLIECHAPVKDVWRIAYPQSSLGAAIDATEKARGVPVPDAKFNLTVNGATCDSILNTWRWSKPMQKDLKKGKDVVVDESDPDSRAKRLDYIFVSDPDFASGRQQWSVESVNVGMTMRHPTLKCSLSDHFSIEATLAAKPPTSSRPSAERHMDDQHYEAIQQMIQKYRAREVFQGKARVAHFFTGLLVSIGCLIAVWWSARNFVAFILLLLSTLGLATGVIDGLIGGIFVPWELRTLQEFAWEITNAQQRARRVKESQQ